ncbi:hypothetical protein FDECE_18412 [Fusarium decemcellulare]|nr:hypothetical protein FDECE_18412 [Fusarium decemcellulare]
MTNTRSVLRNILLVVSTVTAAALATQRHTILTNTPYMPRTQRGQAQRVRFGGFRAYFSSMDGRNILLHDESIAQLGVCGGMPGSIDRCQDALATRTGEIGTAVFIVTAAEDGANITVSKKRWMERVQAARAECPAGSLEATCRGDVWMGDVEFALERPGSGDL